MVQGAVVWSDKHVLTRLPVLTVSLDAVHRVARSHEYRHKRREIPHHADTLWRVEMHHSLWRTFKMG